jgi:hypothetical protein
MFDYLAATITGGCDIAQWWRRAGIVLAAVATESFQLRRSVWAARSAEA